MSYRPYLSSDIEKTRPQIRIYPGITSASIIWDIPHEFGSGEYQVVISDANTEQVYTHFDNTFFIRTGLEPNTTYNVQVYTRNGPNLNLEYSTDFSTMDGDSDNLTSEETSEPKEPCKCKDEDDCTTCDGAPFCLNGDCAACNPNSRISTDSKCYADGYVCEMNNGKPSCESCITYHDERAHQLCKNGYGDEYMCDFDSGKCIVPMLPLTSPSPSPPPSPSPSPGLSWQSIVIIIGVVGFMLVIIMLMVLYFSGTKIEY